ncbi:MAG: YraN family protein [Planctomycetota bacterium]|nr:YraN family protein [Planctomycetota bacterium]
MALPARQQIGDQGEEIAVQFLAKNGYVIVDRKVALRRGEIDIVARQGGDLVFVEVKTRTNTACGAPAEAVTPEKARRLALGVREYIYANLLTDEPMRCDVVSVLLPAEGKPQIEIIRDALPLGDILQSPHF